MYCTCLREGCFQAKNFVFFFINAKVDLHIIQREYRNIYPDDIQSEEKRGAILIRHLITQS